jgi:quinol monooxygenase YgiN
MQETTRDRGNPHDATPKRGMSETWTQADIDKIKEDGKKMYDAITSPPPPPQAGAIPATQAEADARRLIEQWGELDEYDQYLAVPTMTALIAELDLMHSRLAAAERDRDDARREAEERKASFNLRWKADMRAIKRWQEAHPGNELTWPDHADLCVWLMEENDRLRGQNAAPGTGGTTGGTT